MGFDEGRKTVGLYTAAVLRREQVTPHMVRVTIGGEDLARLPHRGYDHWFRLFLPRPDGETDFAGLPDRFTMKAYLRYMAADAERRPPFRNYTIREHRPEAAELDIDFVAHGDEGVAGAWAQRAEAGERVAFIDQGRGFDPMGDGEVVLVGDESALPAIVGILRDLPRDAAGVAILEIPSAEDAQPVDAPVGVDVRWLPRADPHARPGEVALEALRAFVPAAPHRAQAYIAGEQRLAAEGRRHLVAAGVPKGRIVFTGYWRYGKAS